METQITIQIVAIIGSIAMILGWVVRTVLNYFMARNTEKDAHIIELVRQNQKNVDAFRETVNHNQTKFNTSVDALKESIDAQTEVFKQLIKK